VSPLTCGQRTAVVLASLLLWAARASAATVILSPPAPPSSAIAEALVRVRGELVSEGFAVEVADATEQGIPPDARERLRPKGEADAVVAILGGPMPDAVEIRIVDPVTGNLVVRRMSFPSSGEVTAKTLAIHTLELIRASFLELDLTPAPRSAPPVRAQPPAPSPVAVQSAPRQQRGVSVDVGAAAVFELDARVPMVLPVIRLGWALRPWLLPQLTAAGFGTHRTVTSDGASAELSQEFALVGASYRFRQGKRLCPFLSLAAGLLHMSAHGQATPPDWATNADQWSFLLDSGIGAGWELGERLQLALALQAQVAEPYPAIRFAGTVAETSRRPSLLLTMTIGAWL
jgi:hypothetical protein